MNNDLFSGLGFNLGALVGNLATKIELSKKAMAQGFAKAQSQGPLSKGR